MKTEKKVTLLVIWMLLLSCLYLVSWTYTMDIATPAGSDDPAEADDRMREIKAAVQERLNVEHVFDLTGTEVSHADTGKHTDITCDSIANAGAYSGTTITASSTLDVAGNIDPTTYETTNGGFLDEDDMASDANDKVASQQSIKKYVDDQITAGADPAYSGGQSHTFNGGLIIKMGQVNVASSTTDTTVTFGTAFPTACITVVPGVRESAGYQMTYSVGVFSITKTSFHFCLTKAAFVNGMTWIAIGH